ncbi:hypothetical protein EWB00_011246 [Schistosoma japonicum]|uniref:Uncharacterized protein n=1 Tax=Schistosoma japonicum TaxID=6182 RepID=A0A4Z2DLT3_SCHJA|nr:hypothetical protein EWB00_011246 [Schistosoma japonicum]
MLSSPADLPLSICWMAKLISLVVGGSISIGRSEDAASMIGGFSRAVLFKSSLKCSTNLFRCDWFAILIFIGQLGLLYFPASFFVTFYIDVLKTISSHLSH